MEHWFWQSLDACTLKMRRIGVGGTRACQRQFENCIAKGNDNVFVLVTFSSVCAVFVKWTPGSRLSCFQTRTVLKQTQELKVSNRRSRVLSGTWVIETSNRVTNRWDSNRSLRGYVISWRCLFGYSQPYTRTSTGNQWQACGIGSHLRQTKVWK